MLRKLGIAALAAALTAPLVAAPVAALELEPAPAPGADATAPTRVEPGRHDDGLSEVAVTVPLAADGRALDLAHHGDDAAVAAVDHEHADHGDHAQRSGVLALPTSPEMLILEDVPAGAALAVRSRSGGAWTPWTEVVASADDAPDGAADSRPGVGPVWIGHGATEVELASLDGAVDRIDVVGLHVEPEAGTAQGVRSFSAAAAASSTTSPFIRPRTDWATSDMGWRCSGSPSESKDLRAMVVHHTATNTAPYAQADVPSILRGFWRYHVETRKWCDVAYNFFVDRFGTLWEGRQGGITRAILGGHTYGFNSETTSVAQVGNFQETTTPWAMTAATRKLVGWKLGLHGIDPAGRTTLTNRTGGTIKGVANGGQVPVPTVPGHRDLGTTSCPGDHSYDTLPYVRAQSRTGAHVVALHDTFMQALPTPDQYRRWLSTADADGLRAAALGMARSEAYSGVIIDDLYRRVLDRSADPGGKEYWLDILASGVRIETVGISFYGSKEYFDRKGGAETFVRSLYENLLFREADRKGLDYWVGMLQDRRATPADVASGFYLSLESRLDRAARVYESILGRRPAPEAQQDWAQRLLKVDDVLMAVELSLSDEFYERATS